MNGITIADLTITSVYRVYDVNKGQFIFSWLDRNVPGDVPPDVATLPVVGLRAVSGILYIDVMA